LPRFSNSGFRLPAFLLLLSVSLSAQAPGAESQRQTGLAHLQDGQFGVALEAYRRALELDPDYEILYLETADIYLASGLGEEAEGILEEATARFPDSTSPAYNLLYHDLAELWASDAGVTRAADAMEAAGRFQGPVPLSQIHRRIGDYNADLLRLDRALTAYEESLALDPGNAATRLALGTLELRRNDLDAALAAFEAVLQEFPDSVDALHGIAEVHYRRGDFTRAAPAASQVLQRVPDHRNALYIRATSRIRMGRRDALTVQDLERYSQLQAEAQAEEHRVRDIHTYRTGGMRHQLGGRYDEAIALVRAGIEAYPGADVLYLALGQAQSEAGRHDAAIATFLSMLDAGLGESALIHRNLAREYRLFGDVDSSSRHQALYEAGLAAGQRP
jgi:tetratricopeptide (TPR) repeat protein